MRVVEVFAVVTADFIGVYRYVDYQGDGLAEPDISFQTLTISQFDGEVEWIPIEPFAVLPDHHLVTTTDMAGPKAVLFP